MGFLTTLRYSIARMALKAGGLSVVSPWVKTSFLTPTFENLTREGYNANAVVTACISLLTFTYPEPPLMVWSKDADPLPDQPLRQLLVNPNPIMGEDELWQYTIAYAALGGNAFWHKVRSGGGRVVQLWPYHTGQMRVIPGGDEWVADYEFLQPDGSWLRIPKADVVHFKWPLPDPAQPWQAQPPLRSVARAIDTVGELVRYLFALLKNDGIPRTIVTLPPDREMDLEAKDRFRAKWRQTYGGDGRGDIAILDDGATVQRLALDMSELAFDALRKTPEADIAAAFRIPPILAGLRVGLDASTYSNYEQARKAYTQDTLVPLWRAWAAEVQSSLAPDFGGNIICKHDLNEVASLQEDVNARWARVDRAFNSGYISMQETRGALGFGDPDAADLFVVRMSAGLEFGRDVLNPQPAMPAPQIIDVPPAQLTDGMMTDGKGRQTKASGRRMAQGLQRIRAALAKHMEKDVDRFFEKLAATVAGRVGKGRKALDADELITAADFAPLASTVKSYYVEIISASWETWNSALGVDVVFEDSDPAVVQALKDAGKRVTDITETTREFLANVLADSADAGLTPAEMIPGIRLVIEESYKGRARAIARTELAHAQQITATTRYKANGVEKVLVLDGGGEDSDDECNQLNGTIQTLEWAEENPLQHPNCTRAFAPHFD